MLAKLFLHARSPSDWNVLSQIGSQPWFLPAVLDKDDAWSLYFHSLLKPHCHDSSVIVLKPETKL